MFSSRLIQLIEGHADQITTKIIQQIRADPDLRALGELPEFDLQDKARGILKNLGHWLFSKDDEIAMHYQRLGRMRFEESVPLHEILRALQIIKENMISFAREQGMAGTAVDIYAEEELEYSVDRFFDHLIYHFVRGYEVALREAVHLPQH
ncbi:MAG TPA: hypothetical protein VGJ22_05640 [Anaerolineales bacterium]